MRKKYIIANWKMNPVSFKDARMLFLAIKNKAPNFKNIKTIICPPFVYLDELTSLYSGDKIEFGAQDAFWQNKGSFTGEVSPTQIKDLGADYCILGHSERRALGETNEIVNKKIKASLEAGLNIILCVGESERNDDGEHLHFIKSEIKESLKAISKKSLGRIIIAYEPIWAIGKDEDKAMTPEVLYQMKLFILKVMREMYGERGMETTIIYGGSSAPENAEKLIEEGKVDGLLVGHASLVSSHFVEILKVANLVK